MKKLFLLLFLLISVIPGVFAQGEQLVVDRVIAVVNKEVITQSEFDTIFRPIYEEMKKAGASENTNELHEVRLKLLNQMIEDRLVAQEAKRLGIEVSDQEVADEIENLKKDFPDEATFHQQMKAEGVTMTDLEKRFRERLSIEKLHEYVIRGKTVIPPAEAEQYFKDHPDEFIQKERIKVGVITLRKSDEAVQKGIMDEVAKAEAARLKSALERGEDFSKLAEKYSHDSYAKNGGMIGTIEKGTMLHSIEDVLFTLESGTISQVLETEEAYHIFKVFERFPSQTHTFDEMREHIQTFLFRKKSHERFIAWMDELKKKSYISIR